MPVMRGEWIEYHDKPNGKPDYGVPVDRFVADLEADGIKVKSVSVTVAHEAVQSTRYEYFVLVK